ncbi:GNAT family N-acetyltransferase [Tumebacillus lipolyticus]|uniref:GNAT family N-acetyltransferase n=1 Tax=Tumebacillus lipolyticus TaxID=1280370 RepID=A0ABW4ZSM6_9BACL
MIQIGLAPRVFANDVVRFFATHVRAEEHPGISPEFLCPDGVRAAVQRRQLLLAIEDDQIIGALRFFPKKNGRVSVYQFAVAERYRGNDLLQKMLTEIACQGFDALCPASSALNGYFDHKGWQLTEAGKRGNRWTLDRSANAL